MERPRKLRLASLLLAPGLLIACTPDASPSQTADDVAGEPAAGVPDDEARRQGLAAFQRGLNATGDDAESATAAFREAAGHLPVLDDWASVLIAEAAAEAGDTAAARRHLDELADDLAWEWGWRLREQAHLERSDSAGALSVLEVAAGRLTSDARRARAWVSVARLRESVGDDAGSVRAYREAMDAAPQAAASVDAARAMSDRSVLTPEDRLRIGEVYRRHGNARRAMEGIEAYLAVGGGSAEERAGLRFALGRSLFAGRQYADAERHLAAAADDGSLSAEQRAEALLFTARSRFRDGRRDLARETFLSVPDRFPGTRGSARALYIVADLDHDDGRLAQARTLYRRSLETGADSDYALLSALRLAGLSLLNGNASSAAEVLEVFLAGDASDGRRAQAWYWLGRARADLGDGTGADDANRAAHEADPVSFYGLRAAERLGASLRGLLDGSPAEPDEATAEEVAVGLFRVELLRDLDLNAAADFELDRLRLRLADRPAALYPLAEALIETGRPVQGILLGREIHRLEGAWNPRLLRIVWPFPYRELIERESARHGLDPFMVAGLIRQESMFNRTAVSPVGAVGLMQVMPATGRDLARSAGIGNFDTGMLRDPEINVPLGTRFLRDMTSRYDGSAVQVFAAYNAGPTRVNRWRAYPELVDDELFAERIPFEETRNYVKILQFNREMYRVLYGDEE